VVAATIAKRRSVATLPRRPTEPTTWITMTVLRRRGFIPAMVARGRPFVVVRGKALELRRSA
jgi:hypothetical protein